MITKKLLMGGTAAVGSVATVAVVTDQLGNPSKSPSKSPQQLEAERVQKIKDSREKITKWLGENKGSNNWQIKIKDSEGTKKFTEGNPVGLSDYLERNSKLFKSISSGTESTFTFRKNETGEWENIFDKEQINTWINNTSGNKANLKFTEHDKTRSLEDVLDLNQFFESLEKEEELFASLKDKPEETILFEKYWSEWKHTKTEIKNWAKENNFEIKIMKDNGTMEDIDKVNENDLVGLMEYFYSPENSQQLSKYKLPAKEKATWIFKKENTWKEIYKQETINNWIENASDKKASFRLFEKGVEKKLSDINTEDKLKELFNDLTGENHPFKPSLENYVLVFEKYERFYLSHESWIHVKDALNDLIIGAGGKINLDQIEIQIDDKTKEKKKVKEVEDEKLIGLLEHMKSKKDTYKDKECLVLKKDGDTWQEVADEVCKKTS